MTTPVPPTEPSPAPDDGAQSRQQVAELVARLSSEEMDASTRRRLLAKLSAAVANSARTAGGVAVLGGRWLVDLFVDVAPRIPVRDAQTLRDHYDGLNGEALADQLVVTAGRATALVGAAGGALAAIEWAAPPALLSMPIQVARRPRCRRHRDENSSPSCTRRTASAQRAARTSAHWPTCSRGAERRGVDPLNPADVLARIVRRGETIAA